ncbi:otogelin-like protein, partial [Lampetra fluviatilis]
CQCLCTALAAYSAACCQAGIVVAWRTPDLCPVYCDYYNRDPGDGPFLIESPSGSVLFADRDSGSISLSDDVASPGASFMVVPGLFKQKHDG